MKNPAERFLHGLLYLFLGIALAAPLFVTSHLVGNLAFIKLSLFHIAVELALVVWLVLLAQNPARYAIRFSGLSLAVLAFLSVLTLATIFSVDPHSSFWGDTSRFTGLWTYLHLGAFYLVMVSFLRTKREYLWVLKWMVLVGLAVGIYTVLQFFGLDFVRQSGTERLIGPMSNPLELAGYSTIVGLLALGFLINTKYIIWRLLAGATFLLALTAVWWTDSTGGALALGAGVGVLGLHYIFKRFKSALGFAVVGVLTLAVVGGGGWYLSKSVQTDLSAQTRLHAWQLSLVAAAKKPVLGVGLENYSIAFQQNYQPFVEEHISKDVDPETWFDRAHNSFLDYLVMAGILGLVAYLALLLCAVRSLSAKAPGWRRRLAPTLLAALAAYVVFNLTAFDFGANLMLFFAVLALIGSRQVSVVGVSKPQWGYLWLIPLVLVSLVVTSKLVYANRVAGSALVTFARADIETSTSKAELVTESSRFVARNLGIKFLELGGALVARTALEELPKLEYLANYYETHSAQALNGQHAFVLGNFYREMAKRDAKFETKALSAYERSLELAPRRPLTHIVLGEAYMRYGQGEAALDQFQTAVVLLPEKASSYFWLSAAYINLREVEPSLAAFEQALALGFEPSDEELNFLRNLFVQAGQVSRFDTIAK